MIKIFEMFSGYGGASFGLRKANIPFECIGISETDKFAVQFYHNNFPNIRNFGDCVKIDVKELPDFDLLTGGFPCQDVSIAGNRDLNKGRTNLYLEILRIAKDKKPGYMLLENVKGLLSMNLEENEILHNKLIDKIVRDLKNINYGICWKVLNSKDYGIPQNRERVWFVCKYNGWEFMEFQFPEKEELNIFIKDICEKRVDDKYYISEKALNRLNERNNLERDGIIGTITSSSYKQNWNTPLVKEPKMIQFHNNKEIRKYNNISPALIPRTIDNNLIYFDDNPMILDCYNHKIIDNGICIALTDPKHNNLRLIENKIIRKLTPKECFRLMGFLNDEINLKGLSDTQCCKLAGNGWDINLASKIFKQLYKSMNKEVQVE